MPQTNTVARAAHDVGLAAWFGGSLMGAVGLNSAAAAATDPKERTRLSTLGWTRWAPVNAAAIGAHLLGGAVIVAGNRSRLGAQSGVATWTASKTVLTGLAVAATAASGYYNRKLSADAGSPAEGATEPSAATPQGAAEAQRALKLLQWVIPATTGALLVTSAGMGEQQRPTQVAAGLAHRILPS